MYACGDIAHYDIEGFKSYYNYSFRELENHLLKDCWSTDRFTDIDRIFKELKIGKQYFKERDFIDIDKISLKQLKSIIKECGWEVKPDDNNYWKLSKDIKNNISYSFDIDVLNSSISRIMREINYIANSFNKESYIENMVSDRNKIENPPTISEIVSISNDIKYKLMQLSSNVLYKSRIVAEEIEANLNKEQVNVNFEYEY